MLTITQIKETVTDYFKDKPVKQVFLFGSYARGEATEDSDVDLLLELDQAKGIGWEYYSWFDELRKKLNSNVDIVSIGWENKLISHLIDADKIAIYERGNC